MPTKENSNIIEVTHSNGTVIKIDKSKLNGHLLFKCRDLSGGSATIIYMLSEAATFDGKTIPAPELMNWDAFDIVELEQIWADLKTKK